MPEGDTIFRAARALRQALEGEAVTPSATSVGQVRALGEQRLVGQTVAAVEPRGKHLLIWFAPSGLALHSHMRMTGSWHLYRHGQRWRRQPHRVRFRLETAPWLALCFAAPVIELLSADQVAHHPSLAALGPDALGEEPDLDEVRRRLAAVADTTIGEALLDQRVMAGVGNVYKNEVLFIHGVDPWTPVAEVDAVTRDALLDTAVQLLRRNVRPGQVRRVTTGAAGTGDELHVYGRYRRPCPRCHRPIAVGRQGDQGRLTYWCRSCQGPGRS